MNSSEKPEVRRDATASYYQEAVELAFDGLGLWGAIAAIPEDVRYEIGQSIAASVENEGMAIYRPLTSDRLAQREREWAQKYAALEREFEQYRNRTSRALGKALGVSGANTFLQDDGSVAISDGRTTVIQR